MSNKQCEIHMSVPITRGQVIGYDNTCKKEAVAKTHNGILICKMHKRHYDSMRNRLNLSLSVDIEVNHE